MSDLLTPALRADVDWYNATVQRLYGATPEWEWYALEAVGGGTLVTGAVPVSVSATGKRVWPKGDGQRFVVTEHEREATKRLYEADTGRCAECCGHGTRWFGWSRNEGARYKPCEFCGETGKAKEARRGE